MPCGAVDESAGHKPFGSELPRDQSAVWRIWLNDIMSSKDRAEGVQMPGHGSAFVACLSWWLGRLACSGRFSGPPSWWDHNPGPHTA